MQLLRRKTHASKWTLWMATSKSKVDEDSLASMNFEVSELVFDHFDLEDAKAAFEKKFDDKTQNTWAERDFFVQKAGKFKIYDHARSTQQRQELVEAEQNLVKMLEQAKD